MQREVETRRGDRDPVEANGWELVGELIIEDEEKTYLGFSLKRSESPGSLMYGAGGGSLNQGSAIVGCSSPLAALY